MPRLSAIPRGCAFNPRCPTVFDRCYVERPEPLPVEDRRVARELARRPLREFQVAGLDRDRVVSRHTTWGPVPLLTRRDLRRLDEAREKIARWEAEQARGNP